MFKAIGVMGCMVALLGSASLPAKAELCAAKTEELNRLQDSLIVEIDRSTAEAGAEVVLSWQATPQKQEFPAFLMLSFDQPVRFSGEGFTALSPGARAPFGISWNQDRTRAIVPLPESSAGEGSLGIHLLDTQKVGIEWSVMGYLPTCAGQPSQDA